ncbi:MAG: hypothetical protein HPY50_13715 [Firmicutes bacterium]|nr:hypothetical protein [Bacillota bacterium]
MEISEQYSLIDYPELKGLKKAAKKMILPWMSNWLSETVYPITKPQMEKSYNELGLFLKEEYREIEVRMVERHITMARKDMAELLERIRNASEQEEIQSMLQEEKYLRDKIQTLELISSTYRTEMLILQRAIESRLMKSINCYKI